MSDSFFTWSIFLSEGEKMYGNKYSFKCLFLFAKEQILYFCTHENRFPLFR